MCDSTTLLDRANPLDCSAEQECLAVLHRVSIFCEKELGSEAFYAHNSYSVFRDNAHSAEIPSDMN